MKVKMKNSRLTSRLYLQHKRSAERRRIVWGLTYVKWRLIWARSGRWQERGNRGNKYVMARPGDRGPYSPENVQIIMFGENIREAHLGKKISAETKRKISLGMLGNKNGLGNKSNLGRKFSARTRVKMSVTRKGRPSPMLGRKHTEEAKRKIAKAIRGTRRSDETRAKISSIVTLWWKKKKSA